MGDFTVRVLRPDEYRAATVLFRSALHAPAPSDEEWRFLERCHQPGRGLGAFGTGLIGTARSFDAELTLPGGNRAALAAVTGVGVRPDWTRRGVLTELMRTQFDDFSARGVPLAALYATEDVIYGRYGYGPATRSRHYTVDRRRAVLRPEVPGSGEVELLDVDATIERLPGIYANLSQPRPGKMTRPKYWWPGFERHLRTGDSQLVTAVHHGPNGADGFVVYTVERKHPRDRVGLRVVSLHAANGAAFAGLWRYLLGVDLVDVIEAEERPLDEPTELLFTDTRLCKPAAGCPSELWLRLVDVGAALAARTYDWSREGEPVVIDVVDPVLKANSGRYRVAPDGVTRTTEPAGLALGVDTLAMLYLGAWRARTLADVGRIRVADPAALCRADRLFRTSVVPWCGTGF